MIKIFVRKFNFLESAPQKSCENSSIVQGCLWW